jgi:hypothetical protein
MKGIYHLADLFNINYDKKKGEYVCNISFGMKGMPIDCKSYLKMYNKRKIFKPAISSQVLYPRYEPGVSHIIG